MIRIGEVVFNPEHPDPIAKKHPLIQINKREAVILTTKRKYGKFKITSGDFKGFDCKNEAYVTETVVPNTGGRSLGRMRINSFRKLAGWLSAIGLISVVLLLIFT